MIVMKIKQRITSLLTLITSPLHYFKNENATRFNYRMSMDTKKRISPSSQGNSYTFVIILSVITLSVILLSLTLPLKFTLIVLFKHYPIIRLLN